MPTYFGRYFISWFTYLFEILSLTYATIRTSFASKAQGFRSITSVVAAQLYFTGWQATHIIVGIAFTVGFVFIAQMMNPMLGFGNADGAIKLLLGVVIRELAPLLTGLIVIARSGTAVASELGNMKVNREVDAMIVMGIHPLNFIVFPRLIGGAFAVLVLGCYFAFFAGFAGSLAAWFVVKIPPAYFMSQLLGQLGWTDFWLLGTKLFLSGLFIFAIASYHGLSAQKSPTEVPIVTTQAVMKSIIFILIINFVISALYYLINFDKMGIKL